MDCKDGNFQREILTIKENKLNLGVESRFPSSKNAESLENTNFTSFPSHLIESQKINGGINERHKRKNRKKSTKKHDEGRQEKEDYYQYSCDETLNEKQNTRVFRQE